MDRRIPRHPIREAIAKAFPLAVHLMHRQTYAKYRKSMVSGWRNAILREVAIAKEGQKPKETAKEFGGCLIELNNTCNLNCVMCNTQSSVRKPHNMLLEDYTKLIVKLSRQGVTYVSLYTVGEPLMYPYLSDAIKIAHAHGIKALISSNANMPEKLKRVYAECGGLLDSLRFSIDGATRETYEAIRIGGKFERMIESCEFVHSVNRGKRDSRLNLAVNFTVSRDNILEIPLFLKIFSKYAYPQNIGFNVMMSASPDLTYYNEKKLDYKHLFRINVPCNLVFNNMNFTSRGEATLCCRDYNGDLIIGDALDTPLDKIWTSEAAESVRRQHNGLEKLTIGPCINCHAPLPVVSMLFNHFAHYQWIVRSEKGNHDWAETLIEFLDAMNVAARDGWNAESVEHILEFYNN